MLLTRVIALYSRGISIHHNDVSLLNIRHIGRFATWCFRVLFAFEAVYTLALLIYVVIFEKGMFVLSPIAEVILIIYQSV